MFDGNYRLTSPRTRECFRQCAGFNDYPPSIAGTIAYWLGGCLAARRQSGADSAAEQRAACAFPYSTLQIMTTVLVVAFGILVIAFVGLLAFG